MRITNRTRGTVLGTQVRLADTWWGRFRGFLARPRPEPGQGILLSPCGAVHTFGMRFALDVIFLDSGGDILAMEENMVPWRTSSRIPGARYVLEVPAGTIQATGTAVGDTCVWTRVARDDDAPRFQETS
jgi:hypothetical protein